ncbi:hypothetical protein [Lunatibacter salilacus]|uniref:hypothetical protein n=1 Tax=Lunatibacter salilacus TaxID=2483804 RepID=UPI00131AB0A2|nr:hypothetical protein [Lunatibacter salilacus]
MNPHLLLVILILSLVFVACEKPEEPVTIPNVVKIDIAGEGGEYVMELGVGDWQIARIVNNNGNQRMFGDSYTADGEIIRQNHPLELTVSGSLVASGSHRGFVVTLENTGFINIALQENGSENPFSFTIILQSGDQSRELIIDQAISAGYSMEGIEYFLDSDDQDSLYMRNQVATYKFDLLTPQEIKISPFNGYNLVTNSYFASDDPDAFIWLAKDSVSVSIPSEIYSGDILLADRNQIYGGIVYEPYKPEVMVAVPVPAGVYRFGTDVELRRRTVSFRMTLTSKSTGESKEILGKWIETSPTGKYEFKEID